MVIVHGYVSSPEGKSLLNDIVHWAVKNNWLNIEDTNIYRGF